MAEPINPPQWAYARARELYQANLPSYPGYDSRDVWNRALARYIAQHEQEPVDPDLLLAREATARSTLGPGWPEKYRSGAHDDHATVQAALAAIKLFKERQSP